jgi:signal transduction histidine kinase
MSTGDVWTGQPSGPSGRARVTPVRPRTRRRRGKDPTVRRAVARFAVTAFAGLLLVASVAMFGQRKIAEREALRDARESARLVAQGIIGPVLTQRALDGRQPDAGRLDRVVRTRVLDGDIVRVKIWDARGRIRYSDERRLVGAGFALGDDELAAFRSRRPVSAKSELSRPENRYERGSGPLMEFYLPERTAGSGRTVLIEMYERLDAATESTTTRWLTFAPALLGSLFLLWALQVPLAAAQARRLRADGLVREQLLARTADASQAERRRIAAAIEATVTTGVAGVADDLEHAGAHVDRVPPSESGAALHDAVAALRHVLGRLRALVVEIHRPAGEARDIGTELDALSQELAAVGIVATVDVVPGERPSTDAEEVILVGASEAVRNVAEHSHARAAWIRLTREGDSAVMVVEDDGRGIGRGAREVAVASGRLGLAMLHDLARDAGGSLRVEDRVGGGTRLRLEVPWT